MSSAHRLHPEFGFFCPTPRFRSFVRRALVLTVGGAVIGAFVLKAVYEPQQAGALTVAAGAQPSSGITTKAALEPSTAVPTEKPSPPTVAKLKPESPRLESVKTAEAQKPRAPRAANESPPIAVITIGQGAPPPAGQSAAPTELDGGPSTAPSAPKAVEPSVRSTSLPKERREKLAEPPRAPEAAPVPTAAEPAARSISLPKERREKLTESPRATDAAPVPPQPAVSTTPTKAYSAKPVTRSAKVPAEPSNHSAVVSERRAATSVQKRSVDRDAVKTVSRDVRSRDSHRSAKVSAPPEKRDVQPLRMSPTKLATQVRQCVEFGRCRAGEQLLRTLLSSGM